VQLQSREGLAIHATSFFFLAMHAYMLALHASGYEASRLSYAAAAMYGITEEKNKRKL
jgi:hypothetical protein